VRAWLAAGAPIDTEFEIGAGASLPDPEANEADAAQTSADPDEPEGPSPAPEAVLTTLRERLVHVQPIEADSVELWIDFAAAAKMTDDAAVRELLTPLVNHVSELSLARTQITDASLELIAAMPALSRLDLRETAVTEAGLALLAQHAQLSQLVVSRTKLSDSALDSLQELPALTQLWIWEAGLSEEGLLALREALPEVQRVHERRPGLRRRPRLRIDRRQGGRFASSDQLGLSGFRLAGRPAIQRGLRWPRDRLLLPELPQDFLGRPASLPCEDRRRRRRWRIARLGQLQ